MKDKKTRIVFMGTPDFSAAHLKKIVDEGYHVVGVFSQPDKISGRGSKLRPTPVKVMAQTLGIPVFQPKSVNSKKGLDWLKNLNPKLIIVVAFGKILKESVINLPEMGTINVHASLLPKYRGAAPIQRAIENGEKETGISIMKIVPELDAGDVAMMKKVSIESNDTLNDVYDKLEEAGTQLLVEFLNNLEQAGVTYTPQDHKAATYAAKIEKQDLNIDWTQAAESVHHKIRAFDPVPCARSLLNGKPVKIKSSLGFYSHQNDHLPGTILEIDKEGASIKCGEGMIKVAQIQLPSKSFITFYEAKNGRKIEEGEKFTNE